MTTKAKPASDELTGNGNGIGANGVSKGKYTTTHRNAQAPNNPNSLKAWAMRYALAGWRVLPLVPGGKNPLTSSGVYDATDDPETIADWWNRWPSANIGLALGDGLVALDLDPRNGGNLAHLEALDLEPTATATARTAGGGWHVVYQKPAGMRFVSHVPRLPGLDILTGSRYIVAAPSTVDGKRYRWERDPLDCPPARMPLHVAERLQERPTAPQDAPQAAGSGSPGQWTLQDVEAMLGVLDPWQDGYDWWIATGMAIHSEYPGADGLAAWEQWADGKPGECERKWKSFRKSGVTLGTLVHYAKLAGWKPDPKPTPEIWRVQPEDVQKCPLCGMVWHGPTSDRRTVEVVLTCGNKDCPGERKRRAKNHFGRMQDWQSVYLAMVEDGPDWRKAQETARKDAPDFVGVPSGDDVILVSPVPVGEYQWQQLTVNEALATLTGAIEFIPKTASGRTKRIRHCHGKGPRTGKRAELPPELRELRYVYPREDRPLVEEAYQQSGIAYTIRHGRLASLNPLTSEQVTNLAGRMEAIAQARQGWRKVGKLQRLRPLRIGTSETHRPRKVPIHGLGDPVELSTFRQVPLLPSEVPKRPEIYT